MLDLAIRGVFARSPDRGALALEHAVTLLLAQSAHNWTGEQIMFRAVHLYFGVMPCVYKKMRNRRSPVWDPQARA
jgi:hypothetical protein